RSGLSRNLRFWRDRYGPRRRRYRLRTGEAILGAGLRDRGGRGGAAVWLCPVGPAHDRAAGIPREHRLVTGYGQARPALPRDTAHEPGTWHVVLGVCVADRA